MRIALAQSAGTPGDVAANLATIARLTGDAARAGARLVVFPEAFVTGYNIGAQRAAELAEPVDGPSVAAVARTARDAGIAVLTGYVERAPDGAVHNSAVLVDRDGATLANARKAHLFSDHDRAAYAPGDALTLTALDGVRLGILICFDVEFPEPVRRLALAGAQLVAVPTSLMTPAEVVAEILVPARAAENQAFVAYANRIGTEGELTYVGRSRVAGPDGSVLATAGATEETLVLADVDPARIDEERAAFSYLAERRPELAPG
jgi:predicted amidohydrolase